MFMGVQVLNGGRSGLYRQMDAGRIDIFGSGDRQGPLVLPDNFLAGFHADSCAVCRFRIRANVILNIQPQLLIGNTAFNDYWF
ncbi:hypothetical protein D3C73_1340260 [compost metagenome]